MFLGFLSGANASSHASTTNIKIISREDLAWVNHRHKRQSTSIYTPTVMSAGMPWVRMDSDNPKGSSEGSDTPY